MVPVLPTPTVPRSDGVPTKSKLLTSGVHCPAGRFPIRPKILAILTVFEASWRAREFETSPTVPCADRVTGMRLVPLPPSSTEVHEVVIVLCCTRMSCPDATDASIWPNWTVGVSMLTVHETGNFTRTADGKGIETVGGLPHALNFANTSGTTLYVPGRAFGPAWTNTLPVNVDGYDIVSGFIHASEPAATVGAAQGHKGCE
ncbi:Uncharacterised protein [Klebsiella pneumoniae]|nr:hypothetical protein SL24_03475 [Klebsiella pneumoniae]KMH25878.1 hypothetical protein SM69_03527 [Klebsiella pneumoniae]STU90447.1 Uncharacterised protein [Klebsiella pneumoniae]SYK15452.1 Uncharacterised protein [Klebsiella pneumoniae]